MYRATLVAVGLALVPNVTLAQQAPQREIPISALQNSCNRSANETPRTCAAIAAQARSRYGEQVSIYQWNAAVGVVRNLRRQGKI